MSANDLDDDVAGSPPDARGGGQSDDEIRHYVEAFARSSDRARFAFYTVIIGTFLIAIANWNVQGWSWPRLRMAKWNEDSVRVVAARAGRPVEQQRALNDEYARQFTSRVALTDSPIPGVAFDINDMGTLGGFALMLLMMVLALSLDREHENLHLAFYKVRLLAEGERGGTSPPRPIRGDGQANLLYHALAMTQVLSSPPTLVRWGRRGLLHRAGAVYFFPAVVYGWVVLTNWQSISVAKGYGANADALMAIQYVFFTLILLLSFYTWAQSRAMDKRWRRIFEFVNPNRRHLPQMKWWEWLKVPLPKHRDVHFRSNLKRTLVERVNVEDTETHRVEVAKAARVRLPVRGAVLDRLVADLNAQARKKAEDHCREIGARLERMIAFHPYPGGDQLKVDVDDGRFGDWSIRGEAEFCFVRLGSPPAEP